MILITLKLVCSSYDPLTTGVPCLQLSPPVHVAALYLRSACSMTRYLSWVLHSYWFVQHSWIAQRGQKRMGKWWSTMINPPIFGYFHTSCWNTYKDLGQFYAMSPINGFCRFTADRFSCVRKHPNLHVLLRLCCDQRLLQRVRRRPEHPVRLW